MFFLQLVGDAWMDVAEGQTKEIRLTSINTGAGDVEFKEGGLPDKSITSPKIVSRAEAVESAILFSSFSALQSWLLWDQYSVQRALRSSYDIRLFSTCWSSGVVIAEVRPDSLSALCEDSCAYANDGRCDEPRGVRDPSSLP